MAAQKDQGRLAEPQIPEGLDAHAISVIDWHRGMALRFAEDRDVQKHRARKAEAEVTRLTQERELLLDHLDHARQAIADAQQWSNKWKDHAFAEQAKVSELRQEHERLTIGRETLIDEIDRLMEEAEQRNQENDRLKAFFMALDSTAPSA